MVAGVRAGRYWCWGAVRGYEVREETMKSHGEHTGPATTGGRLPNIRLSSKSKKIDPLKTTHSYIHSFVIHTFSGKVELRGGGGVDVHQGGDGASVGRLHGVRVDVEGRGDV